MNERSKNVQKRMPKVGDVKYTHKPLHRWHKIYPQTCSGEWIQTKIGIHKRTKTLNDDRNIFRCLTDKLLNENETSWQKQFPSHSYFLNYKCTCCHGTKQKHDVDASYSWHKMNWLLQHRRWHNVPGRVLNTNTKWNMHTHKLENNFQVTSHEWV